MMNLPDEINLSLLKQEKHLMEYKEEENAKEKLAVRIAKKIHKDKKDLLLNQITTYRAKKELHELIDQKQCEVKKHYSGKDLW